MGGASLFWGESSVEALHLAVRKILGFVPVRPLLTITSPFTFEQNPDRTSQGIDLNVAKADEGPEQRHCHISLEPRSKVKDL